MTIGQCLRPALIGLTAVAVVGCGEDQIELWAYYQHPQDAQVRQYAFTECLTASRPPSKTHYNDQDEVVEACGRWADDVARYCPDGADCLPQYRRSREEVRRVLPQPKTTLDKGDLPEGGEG